MCRTLFAVLAVILITFPTHADEGTTDRVLRASCRIFAGNARGSGVIFDAAGFGLTGGNYRVLKNAHVVGSVGNRITLEFEHSGYRSGPIPGRPQ